MEDAKFQLQSKLGMWAPDKVTFPKLFSKTLHQFSTCFGFLSLLPTCAVITPPFLKFFLNLSYFSC